VRLLGGLELVVKVEEERRVQDVHVAVVGRKFVVRKMARERVLGRAKNECILDWEYAQYRAMLGNEE